MMECTAIREMLPAYLEKALAPQEEMLIAQHLSSCRNCARALLDLKRTGEMIKDLDAVEPPPWMTQKIMSRIRAEEEKKSLVQKLFFPLHVKIPIQAFTTVVIAVLAVYLLKGTAPESNRIPSPSSPEQAIIKEEPPETSRKPEADLPSLPPLSMERSIESAGEEQAQRPEGREKAAPVKKQRAAGKAKKVPPIKGAAEEKSKPPIAKKEAAEDAVEAPAGRQALPSPAPTQQEEAAGVMRERKALSAAAPRAKADQVRATVSVEDVSKAMKDVEELLGRLGALKIKKESLPNRKVVTAELRTEKVQEVIEALMQIGEVGVSHPSSKLPEEGVPIRIEIVKKK